MTEPTSDTPALPADVAAMPLEAARSELDASRADLQHPVNQPNHPRHAEAATRLKVLYQRIHGTGPAGDGPPSAAAPPAPDPHAPPDVNAVSPVTAATLPPGYTWDDPTLTALGEVATREQLDPGLMREGTALVAQLLGERAPVLSGEEAELLLEQRWGSKYEYQIAQATETWNLLPRKVQDDLTKSGIRYHPEFAEFLLKMAEHRWDPMTDAGLARIKARGLAALQAEAKQAGGRT
jgi:hypothetical protein